MNCTAFKILDKANKICLLKGFTAMYVTHMWDVSKMDHNLPENVGCEQVTKDES